MTNQNFQNKKIIICGLVSYKIQEPTNLFSETKNIITSKGGEIVEVLIQRRGVSRSKNVGGAKKLNIPLSPSTYISKGKAYQLKELCYKNNCDIIIFINKLSKGQLDRLSKLTNCKVIYFEEII